MTDLCPECPLNKQVGNIRNLQRYLESVWPWDIFNDCFGGKIALSDLDGIVERRGQVLVLEAKGKNEKGEWVNIPKGQEIMFEKMVSTGYFTIVILWGEPGKPVRYQSWDKSRKSAVKDCDLETIRNLVRGWYKWADTRPILIEEK